MAGSDRKNANRTKNNMKGLKSKLETPYVTPEKKAQQAQQKASITIAVEAAINKHLEGKVKLQGTELADKANELKFEQTLKEAQKTFTPIDKVREDILNNTINLPEVVTQASSGFTLPKTKLEEKRIKFINAEVEAEFSEKYMANTQYYNDIFDRVTDAFNNYIYSEDPEGMSKGLKEWYEDNYVEEEVKDKATGETVTLQYFKASTPPPPLGKNLDGKTIDLSDIWDSYVLYQQAVAGRQRKSIEKSNKKYEYTAGVSKYKPDSPKDVLSDIFAGRYDSAPLLEFKDYASTYIVTPFKEEGAFDGFNTVFMNTLHALGETMDIPSAIMRATTNTPYIMYSESFPYPTSFKRTLENQEGFVYSGGDDLQKELIANGALFLLDSELNTSKYSDNVKYSEGLPIIYVNKLKELGLYEEYIKFKDEWIHYTAEKSRLDHIKSYVFGESSDIPYIYNEAPAVEYPNYYADTGNIATDLVLELTHDPTFIFGALGGVSRSSIKGGIKLGFRKALAKSGIKNIDEVMEVEAKVFNAIASSISDDIFSMSNDLLKERAHTISLSLLQKGVLSSKLEAETFAGILLSDLNEFINSKTFNVVKGIHLLNRGADTVDKSLFRLSTLGIPYAVTKASKSGYRLVQNPLSMLRYSETLKRNRAAKKMYAELRRSDGELNPAQLHNLFDEIQSNIEPELYKKLRNEVSEKILAEGKFLNEFDIEALTIKRYIEESKSPSNFVFERLTAQLKREMSELERILNEGLVKGLGPTEILDNVNNFIIKITDGKITSYKAFENYLDQNILKNANLVSGDIERFVDVYSKQLKRVSDVLELARAKAAEAEFLSAIKKAQIASKKLANHPVYAKPAKATHMKLIESSFKTKKIFNSITDVKDINLPYNRSDILIDKHLNVEFERLLKSALSDMNKYSKGIKGLVDLRLAFANRSLTKVKAIELIDNAIRDLQFATTPIAKKIEYSKMSKKQKAKAIPEGAGNEEKMIQKLQVLRSKLASQTSLDTQGSVEIISTRLDKAVKMDTLLHDKDVQEAIDILKPIADAAELLNHSSIESPYYSTVTTILQVLKNTFDNLDAYYLFSNTVKSCTSEVQYHSIMDALFGFSEGLSRKGLTVGSILADDFISKCELNLRSMFAVDSLALDGFRKQASNFMHEMYTRYSKEIKDPKIQERIKRLCTLGEADTTANVRVQALQLLLKDKNAIIYLNNLAKTQDVFFLDISTTGLNNQLASISGITTLKWKELDPNASLSEILDFLESTDAVKVYQTYRSTDEIKREVSDAFLKSIYRENPSVGNSNMWETYLKKYSSDYNGGKVVTEADILTSFMKDMDESWALRNNSVPHTIVHNSNGFDTSFINSRAMYNETYFSGISDLQAFSINCGNSFERLKSVTENVFELSNEQKERIKQGLVTFYNDIGPHNNNLDFLDLRHIADELETLEDYLIRLKQAPTFSKIDANVGYPLLEEAVGIPVDIELYYREIIMLKDSGKLKEIRDKLRKVDIQTRRLFYYFDNNIIYNPIVRETSSSTINNFFKQIKDLNPHMSVAPLSYSTVFDSEVTKLYFNLPDALEYTEVEGAFNFAKSIQDSFNFQVKKNDLVKEYNPELRAFVNFAVEYAKSFLPSDPYSFLRYLVIPNNEMEVYLIAQKLWDDLFGYGFTKTPFSLSKKQVDNIPAAFKSSVNLYMREDFINQINSVISKDTINLLNGKGHSNIYKFVKPELYSDKFDNYSSLEAANVSIFLDTIRANTESLSNISRYYEASGIENPRHFRTIAVNNLFNNILNTVKKHEDSNLFISKLSDYLKIADDRIREEFMKQVLWYFNNAEDFEYALTSHLLYNNDVLIVPSNNTSLVDDFIVKLIELKNIEVSHLNIELYEMGYIIITTNRAVVKEVIEDSSKSSGAIRYKIRGSDKVYENPIYNDIAYPELKNALDPTTIEALSKDGTLSALEEIITDLKNIQDELAFLTNGSVRGSCGDLMTFTGYRRLLESLPTHIRDNMIAVDDLLDARSWHQASFNRSVLGTNATKWHTTHYEDSDLLLNTQKIINEVSGHHITQNNYLSMFFSPNSEYSCSKMFSNFTDDEVFEAISRTDDFEFVICQKSKEFKNRKGEKISYTDSGYEIVRLNITSAADIAKAKELNAVYVPYEVYTDMVKILNEGTISSPVFKVLSKLMALTKAGQLSKPATAFKNLFDGFIKSTIEANSVTDTSIGFIEACDLLIKYDKVCKQISKANRLGFYSESYVKTLFDTGAVGISKGKRVLTYDEYRFLSSLFENGPMGGMSHQTKDMFKAADLNAKVNRGLKNVDSFTLSGRRQVKETYDMIGSTTARFKSLGASEIGNVLEHHALIFNPLFNEVSITKDDFLKWVADEIELKDKQLLEANRIANEVIMVRADRLVNPIQRTNLLIDNVVGSSLTLMSKTENIIRLGEYLALERQGYTRNAIFKKITASQFDYDVKSRHIKILELFIPYLTFTCSNLAYWVNMVERNPRAIHYLETIWGELSYDASFENYENETPNNNYSLEQVITQGNIPLGETPIYLKVGPSFYSALNLIYGGPSVFLDQFSLPIQTLADESIKRLGNDYLNYLNYGTVTYSNEPSTTEKILHLVPYVGSIVDIFNVYYKKRYKQVKDYGIASALVRIDPFTFGVVTRYNSDNIEVMASLLEPYIKSGKIDEDTLRSLEWETFNRKLAEQGKWYDKNFNKVVDISERNVIGLNGYFDFENDPTAWDRYCRYQLLYRGKRWDNNQRKFVTMAEFIPGMLNREFDFKNPEDWDTFCYYNEELFGTKWDNNQGKFVTSENYIEGGLNSNNLTFSELCKLKLALHGQMWNNETKKFEDYCEPIVSFDFPEKKIDLSTITIIEDERKNVLSKFIEGIKSNAVAYGATVGNTPKPQITTKQGKYVFNTDPVNNANIIMTILKTVEVPNLDFKKDYSSGYAGGYSYTNKPKYVPLTPAMQAYKIGKYGGQYSSPYQGNKDNRGIRMVGSGYNNPDDFYNYSYNKNYQYKNPVNGVANYPQSKLGVDRYMRMRGDRLLNKFKSRTPANARRVSMDRRISVRENLNRIKLGWWNR